MAPQGLICPKMEKYGDISVKKCDFIEVYPRFLVHSTKNLYKEKTGTRVEIWEQSVNILRKRHQTGNLKRSLISQNEFELIRAGARRFSVLERKGGPPAFGWWGKVDCCMLEQRGILLKLWVIICLCIEGDIWGKGEFICLFIERPRRKIMLDIFVRQWHGKKGYYGDVTLENIQSVFIGSML